VEPPRHRHAFVAIRCLGEHLEVRLRLENQSKTRTHQRLVVDDQDSHDPLLGLLLAHLHCSDPHLARPLRWTGFKGEASAAVPQERRSQACLLLATGSQRGALRFTVAIRPRRGEQAQSKAPNPANPKADRT